MFALQHRLNTRQRNSVLKLKVATNCSDWDTRLRIIQACSEEVIADHEHGGGRPHWKILEDLGLRIGLKRRALQDARPLPSTELAWAAWEGLMANRHWLEGIVANTCAERINVPATAGGSSEGTAGSASSGCAGESCSAVGRRARVLRAAHRGRHRALEHRLARGGEIRQEAAHGRRRGESLREQPVRVEHYLNGIAAAGDASRS